MIGSYDFCGHYEWTFAWLERAGGAKPVTDYRASAISEDSQKHARDLIVPQGLEGMRKYWQHTLEEEAAGFAFTSDDRRFRIDILECPSKGFLLQNGLEQYSDYGDHCVGWIGPMMKDAGNVIDHEHNHCGRCWWEFRRKDDEQAPSEPGGFWARDVRLSQDWQKQATDRFNRGTAAGGKNSEGPQ